MNWEPRPVPEVTPETARFWTAASNGTLLVRGCPECDFLFYYPRAHCPNCFSSDITWEEVTGIGTIYSYSVLENASGWPESELPLILSYVELNEGPRLMTNIVDVSPEDLSIDTTVQVSFVPTDNDSIAVPVFSPIEP